MAKKSLPSPELLRKLLRYEPDCGKLFWKTRGFEDETPDREIRRWNTCYAQKEAFKVTSRHGYKVGWVCGKNQKSHRVIWAIVYGEWPVGQIDHINGDRADNRLENLREVCKSLNMRNAAIPKNNKTGTIGVCFHEKSGKWYANIGKDGKSIYLGRFATKAEAVAARQGASIALGYHQNHGNVRKSYEPQTEEPGSMHSQ